MTPEELKFRLSYYLHGIIPKSPRSLSIDCTRGEQACGEWLDYHASGLEGMDGIDLGLRSRLHEYDFLLS